MHSLPLDAHETIVPSITVCDTDVPLPLYWQAVDLWSAGHPADSIVVHIVATRPVKDLNSFHDIVRNIVYNQELVKQTTTVPPALTLPSRDSRRNSCIINVGELDDLSVASMVARKKEKERLGLKQLLSKLS